MSNEMISSFLKRVEGFDCQERTCEPLTSRLKSYFESKECIDFDYSKDTLELSFKIFAGSLEEYSESGETITNISDEQMKGDDKNVQILERGLSDPEGDRKPLLKRYLTTEEGKKTNECSYWFLKLLAGEESLKSLCHHPYITAFLDLHYSTVQKTRSQMQDSVPHMALVLLLLVLVSTLKEHLKHNYENELWLATFPFALVFVLDIISVIGLKTQWINKKMDNSLFQDFQKPKSTWFGMFTLISINITHIIGYFVSIASLVGGYFVSKQQALEEETLKENTRLLQKAMGIMLLVYPMLLMAVEVMQMVSARGLRNHFKSSKNIIDLVEIMFALVIGSMSLANDINDFPWMPHLIWIVTLVSFTQLFYDIVGCLPNNDKFHIQQYLQMFTQVVKRYFIILMGFFPFLMAFVTCFKGNLDVNFNTRNILIIEKDC